MTSPEESNLARAITGIAILLLFFHLSGGRASTVSYKVTDNCGPITNFLSVVSNEPITGLGNTSADWEIIDSHHLRLRAERFGTGTGRVYTITITSRDSAGNSSSKRLFVTVPHDRRR